MDRRRQDNTAERYPVFDIVVLSSRDFLFVRRSAMTWKNEGEPVLLRTRGDKNTPYNETVFSDNPSVVSIGRYSTLCQKSLENLRLTRKGKHTVKMCKAKCE